MPASAFDIVIYNKLPLIEAASAFADCKQVLSSLAPLFASYSGKYGVCLVHRHCRLEEGERMVATGNVSQPENLGDHPENIYPERWLSTGEPYEFTRIRTDPPPTSLFDAFQKILVDMGVGPTTLGIFAINDPQNGGVLVEKTDGRKNITEWKNEVSEGLKSRVTETGWAVRDNNLEAVAILAVCIVCFDQLCHDHI